MDRFLSPKQIRVITSISERQQERLVERGQFPEPIQLYEGGRRKAFRESEIEKWMADRVAAVRGAGAARKAAEPAAGNNGHDTPRADPSAGRRPPGLAQPPPRRAGPKTPI